MPGQTACAYRSDVPTFVVLAHEHPTQVARLAARLAPHPVGVHVNARTDITPFVDAARSLDHVSFLPDDRRCQVNWAGFVAILAIKALYGWALPITEPDDHVVLLSGSDYPLSSVAAFAGFLRRSPHRQHLRWFAVADGTPRHRSFVERRHYRDVKVFPRAPRHSLPAKVNEVVHRSMSHASRLWPPPVVPDGIVLSRGSPWSALTADCVADLLARATPDVDRFFAHTFCPDEMYLHSLVASGPFATQNAAGGAEPCPGPDVADMSNFHHIHRSLDKWYTIADQAELEASSQWFFRKVRPPSSNALLDHLDARDARDACDARDARDACDARDA